MTTIRKNLVLIRVEQFVPWVLPCLLLFSRALADLTIVLIGLLFLYKSHIEKDWQWSSQLWFRFGLLFFAYLLFINTPFSINVSDSFSHALAFIRWPLFAAALAYWLFSNDKRQQQFLISLLVISLFIFFDTWWQYFTGEDLFGIAAGANCFISCDGNNIIVTAMQQRLFKARTI